MEIKVADEGVIFVAVDENYSNMENENGIIFFKTDQDARLFRLNNGNKQVIYLNELKDPDCKDCYGTGKQGVTLIPLNLTIGQISEILQKYFKDAKPDIEELLEELVKKLKFPETHKKPLRYLMRYAQKQFINGIPEEVGHEIAKMIYDDFMQKRVNWCMCLLDKLNIEITEKNLQQKYSIN